MQRQGQAEQEVCLMISEASALQAWAGIKIIWQAYQNADSWAPP